MIIILAIDPALTFEIRLVSHVNWWLEGRVIGRGKCGILRQDFLDRILVRHARDLNLLSTIDGSGGGGLIIETRVLISVRIQKREFA